MPSLFGSMLQAATSKVFALDYLDPTIINVRQSFQDWSLAGGDFVEIKRSGYQPAIKRIKHISYRPAGDMQIEVNQRLRTMAELLKGKDDITRLLQSFHDLHNPNAWSWTWQQQNIDSYTPIVQTFLLQSTDSSTNDPTLGRGEIDPSFPWQAILSVKIDWFNTSLIQTTVPTNSHGDVGSHSSYGGGETSAKTQDAHNVPATTGLPQSASKISVCNATSVSFSGSGTTNTGGSSIYQYTGAGGSPSHSHQYTAPAYHAHGFSVSFSANLPYIMADPAGHVHVIPDQYTSAAGAQSHTTPVIPTATRAGSAAHPAQVLTLANDALCAGVGLAPTGASVHYITLTVLVNGSPAPGSPYSGGSGTGLYIGDSVSFIDLTSLLVLGQKNTLSLAISEWGGPGPVKCSLSANVNITSVISAF